VVDAARYPGRIRRLMVENCPHPNAMLRNLMKNPRQMIETGGRTLRGGLIQAARVHVHGQLVPGRSSRAPGVRILSDAVTPSSRADCYFGWGTIRR
jgi:hypothetical protein